ncbi:MAG: ATP-binding protein [Deltaproteobacteria bacterium]|nr:ATP-binding protein [Deltaproteobacteria bacterium]
MSGSGFEFELARRYVQAFDVESLFVEVLGWSQAGRRATVKAEVDGATLQARPFVEMSGVVVYRCDTIPAAKGRHALHTQVSAASAENLLLFFDDAKAPTQCMWRWQKRDGKKLYPREHLYLRGQPGDLFVSKIAGIFLDIQDFDPATNNVPLHTLTERLAKALDVEKVTKKFFREFDEERLAFMQLISGIADEKQRRWYASILMNRLMFVWFLQEKGFLDGGHGKHEDRYLIRHMAQSRCRGAGRYYGEFLQLLFFEGFAKAPDGADPRSPAAKQLLGAIPYLNGGLFLPHDIERSHAGKIRVPDAAFDNLFRLFGKYSWNLNDTPGGKDDEINPDVLGYIFEKYINQKAFGAYYTRPEITEYLCDRTVHRLILQRVRQAPDPAIHFAGRWLFESIDELLLNLDAPLALKLLNDVLPGLKLLDPACGSGAFLVAMLKSLIGVYGAVIGRLDAFKQNPQVQDWLVRNLAGHRSPEYFIKRRIITDNLYGVDIMEEATEIAKLRLFLALVASARKTDELEPLPNIDFNILPGNSLVGLLHVPASDFDARGKRDLFRKSYKQICDEKNRLLSVYRDVTHFQAKDALGDIKAKIEAQRSEAQQTLGEILLAEMREAGVKFEQATWDAKKGDEGKAEKRTLAMRDLEAQKPFHWGFEFDQILAAGGFDGIITNPPWEVWKPQDKEFCADHSELVTKNKMTIKEFEKAKAELMRDPAVREAFLAYLSRFPHMSAWFRAAKQYRFQSAVVGGKKTGSDLNLYKLFTEQCVNLLKPGGECGLVIPSGIYTDLGAKGLRDLLFDHNQVTGLFCFENRKEIFEGVDSRFKFVVLTVEKGGKTTVFPTAFMRHDVAELRDFPKSGALPVEVALVRKLSPDSHSVMEFKGPVDVQIAQKMLRFPLLGEKLAGTWNLELTNEFHMTNDSHLFETTPGPGKLPLFEGKMIWQFDAAWAEPRYWVDAKRGRAALGGGANLGSEHYRLGFCDIASSTNERSLISTVIPPAFHGNKLPTVRGVGDDGKALIDVRSQLFLCALWNSFALDAVIRMKVSSTLNFFYMYQLPVPRLRPTDTGFSSIVTRSARLICTTPAFDDLAASVGLSSHRNGATDPTERARLRAELDGLIAHLYGLSEEEFLHILGTFPLVADSTKAAAAQAFRDVGAGVIA